MSVSDYLETHPLMVEGVYDVSAIRGLIALARAYQEDAERYRALREQNSVMLPRIVARYDSEMTCYTPEALDAAIDAARLPPPGEDRRG